MRFKKGNTSGGRKHGSKNKISQDIREAFKKLIEDNIAGLQNDLDTLDPQQRLKILIDLSAYVIPKLKQSDITASIETSNNSDLISRLMSLSDEQIENEILNKDETV